MKPYLLVLFILSSFIVFAQEKVDSLQVFFHQGKSDIDLSFSENGSRINPYAQKLQSINADSLYKINRIVYFAGGSPEGSRATNARLSNERAASVANYLHQYAQFNDSLVAVNPQNEDWKGLKHLVEASNMPNKARVMQLLKDLPDIDDEAASEALKKKLKQLNKGRTWNYMYRNFFPQLRGAKLYIYYEVVEKAEPVEEKKVEIEPAPEPIEITPPAPKPAPMPQRIPEPVVEPKPEPKPEPKIETRFLGVKTNLLFLAGTIANVGFEYEFAPKWSVDLPIYYSPYDLSDTRKIRVLATQPEVRYWLSKAGEGHYFGVHGHIAGFNVAINDHGRYQDPERPLWGFGLGYGYAINFGATKNWGLEFNLGLGFANYEYEAFYNRPNGQVFRTGEDWYWGVTRAGISLTYKWWKPRKSSVVNALIK